MLKEIRIKDAAQVEKISRLACGAPYEIYLHTGNTAVDARTLLGRNLPLVGKKVRLVAEDCADPIHFGYLVAQMEAGRQDKRKNPLARLWDIFHEMESLYGREARLKHTEC